MHGPALFYMMVNPRNSATDPRIRSRIFTDPRIRSRIYGALLLIQWSKGRVAFYVLSGSRNTTVKIDTKLSCILGRGVLNNKILNCVNVLLVPYGMHF